MANKIVLKGDPLIKEGRVDESVTPGALLEYGGDNDIQNHSSAGQNATAMFALEGDLYGDGIDDAYADGDTAKFAMGRKGDEFYALLDSSSGNITKGDLLESAGNGNLQDYSAQDVDESGSTTYTIYSNAPVVRAVESVDSPTSGNTRIKVEVI